LSHGEGQNATWFSSICKELASQGSLIVISMEHRDGSAMFYKNEEGKQVYH